MKKFQIRPVEVRDNLELEQLIRTVLTQFCPHAPELASDNRELQDLYAFYQQPGNTFLVVVDEDTQKIMGCGGFYGLPETPDEIGICKLKKLYFYPALRGLGIGKQMLERLIEKAIEMGYQEMYLETFHTMTAAIRLYEKFGFQIIDGPKGNPDDLVEDTIFMTLLLNKKIFSNETLKEVSPC